MYFDISLKQKLILLLWRQEIKFDNNNQNYQMSNIRDLQKLKGTKNIHQMVQIHQRIINPQINCFNCEPISSPLSIQHKILKNGLYNKQTFTATTSRTVHRRGGSFGTAQMPQRLTFNLIRNPRLSVYNFPLKIDSLQQNIDGHILSNNGPLKSQRKVKNNYVSCKEQSSGKKSSASQQCDNDAYCLISKASFTSLFPVGKGGFGKVWKVEMKKSKAVFAMKQMSKAKIIAKKSVTSVMNEQYFLSKLNHPFLVNMTYAFQDRQNLYLVMDYLDGGDLRYHLGNKQFFNQKQTKFFLSNIIISLEYLHHHRIIHRDLKPQNLVFDSQGFLKLTDLGISRQLRQDNHQDTSGTPGYMAPEVMLRKSHSFTVDYFALGVIAYELMLGKRPYVGGNRKQIKQQILARQASVKMDQLPFKWSPYSIDFVNKLLLRNPEQRLGARGIEQIKNHPWLAEIDWDKIKQRKIKPLYKPLSIEEDYQNYKEQISEDTLIDNEDQIQIMLRKNQIQQLFQGYNFQKVSVESISKKRTSFPTNSTQENHSKK